MDFKLVSWGSGLYESEREDGMGETNNVEHALIEISNLTKLAYSIKEKLCHESPSLSESCIFKVPRTLRRRNENVFDPNIVSIGPFHRGKDRLAPMEKIKLWYLRCLLDRSILPQEETLEQLVKYIGELQKSACECYAEPINLNNDKFIEMMVVDGYFLIELFRKKAGLVPKHKDDPIFNTSWMRENLCHDLILLENQIPWFVLQRLFELTISVKEQETHFLVDLVLGFFQSMMLMTVAADYRSRSREIKHILDLLRSCLLSSSGDIKPANTGWELLPPVTYLLQAGVKFKRGTPDDILNIQFNNGVFEIPPIKIRGNSESLFQNLIAYEQCDRESTYLFTSYAVFLDCLINTSKDAEVPCNERIVVHASCTEEISVLFNRLYNDTLVYSFYYGGVSHKVNEYYRSRWPKWRTTFKRNYFKNPCPISSFIAAILILLFTFTQTLFTILSY